MADRETNSMPRCRAPAGIIGLFICDELLKGNYSVALVERGQSSGQGGAATGAGQGYIWRAHRDPTSPSWHLANESVQLWQVNRGRRALSSRLATQAPAQSQLTRCCCRCWLLLRTGDGGA